MTIPIVVSQDRMRLVEIVLTAILKYSFKLLKFIVPIKFLILENDLPQFVRLECELHSGYI